MVYRNKAPVPIPKGLSPKPSDGRIEMVVEENGMSKTTIIGYAATSDSMYVNDTYKNMFPDEWIRYYGSDNISPDRLYIGAYALILGAIHKSGIYPLLLKTFEAERTNAILDYAMYSIIEGSDVTSPYALRMRDEVLFSNEVYSDRWYSQFFTNILDTKLRNEFKLAWLAKCKEMGITKAWISIAGASWGSKFTESAEIENSDDSKGVSFIYAINADDGTPITYSVYSESVIGSETFIEITTLLKDASISIEGVILDSEFCSYEAIETIVSQNLDYVIMTPCETYGHSGLAETEGNNIKWKSRFCVSDENLVYGTSQKHLLFETHSDLVPYINLYFDALRATKYSAEVTLKIRKEMSRLQGRIESGLKPNVKPEFSDFLRAEKINGKDIIIPNEDLLDSLVEKEGFFSIASSQDYGAERTLQIFHLKDASETGCRFLKAQEDFGNTHIYSAAGIDNNFAVCFIGNIIRNQILLVCKSLNLDLKEMLQKIDRIYLRRSISNSYDDGKMVSDEAEQLYSAFNIKPEDFKGFAAEVNRRRNTPVSNNVYLLPKHEATIVTRIPGKRGRPKGSKNRKTIEKEKTVEAMILSGIDPSEATPKKPVGRPKGSKDSSQRKRRTKAEIEAANTP
ncbi:MAG: hypothetical protein IJ719_09690 [Clostridia bacterium]|nr:hypothetical protein [Clostridia bacterium]